MRPDHPPSQLLDQVVLLVGQPRRGEEADRLPAVSLRHPGQSLGRGRKRVVPRGRVELAVFAADQRLRQPVGVMHEVEGEPALDAEVAVVGDVRRVRRDLDDPLRLRVDVEIDLAADAAERAGRLRLHQRLFPAGRRPLLELLVDRARRADGEAAAAELALGVEPAAPPRRNHARLAATPFQRQGRALHHFLRVADAARAEDAGVGVVAHQQVAVLVRLALRVGEDERRLDAEVVCQLEELVRPAPRTAVQVLGEQHLGQRPLELRHGRVRRDDHPCGDPRCAGGQRPRGALDPDHAHAAAAVGVELRVVAEGRDEDVVAGERVDEQLALGRRDLATVDRERDHPAGAYLIL